MVDLSLHNGSAVAAKKSDRAPAIDVPRNETPYGLLAQLHALCLHAESVEIGLLALEQSAHARADARLLVACQTWMDRSRYPVLWCKNEILHRSAHTLGVPQ